MARRLVFKIHDFATDKETMEFVVGKVDVDGS